MSGIDGIHFKHDFSRHTFIRTAFHDFSKSDQKILTKIGGELDKIAIFIRNLFNFRHAFPNSAWPHRRGHPSNYEKTSDSCSEPWPTSNDGRKHICIVFPLTHHIIGNKITSEIERKNSLNLHSSLSEWTFEASKVVGALIRCFHFLWRSERTLTTSQFLFEFWILKTSCDDRS